jgi:hypothetical protein
MFGYAALQQPAADDAGSEVGMPEGDFSKTILDTDPPSFSEIQNYRPPAPADAAPAPPAPAPPGGLAPTPPAPVPAPAPPVAAAPAPEPPAQQPYQPTLAAPASLPSKSPLGTGPPAPGGPTPRSGVVPAGEAYQATVAADALSMEQAAAAPAPAGEIPPTVLAGQAQAREVHEATAQDPVPPTFKPVAAAPASDRWPGQTLLRMLMIIGGLLLMGIFAAPWGTTGTDLIFSWDMLDKIGGMAFVMQIYLAAAGLVLLAGGLIPVPHAMRAVIAALLGLGYLGLSVAGAGAWQAMVVAGVLVLVPAGLLHRRRYDRSLLGSLLVTLGFLAVLATMLVPVGGAIPLVGMFSGLGDLEALALVTRLLPLLLLLFALLALLSWIGRPLAWLWAMGLVLFLPLQMLLPVGVNLVNGADILVLLPKLYVGLATFLFLLFAAHGLSLVFTRFAGHPDAA